MASKNSAFIQLCFFKWNNNKKIFYISQQEAIDAFCSDYSITVEKISYLKKIPSNNISADLLDFNAKRRMVKFFILNSSDAEKYYSCSSFRISNSKTKKIISDTSITMEMEEFLTLVSDRSFRNSYIKLCSDENVEQMTMEDAKNSLVMNFTKVFFFTRKVDLQSFFHT